MTAIIGFVENNKIWMGADSLSVTDAFDQQVLLDDKVFIKNIAGLGPSIWGFAGYYRYGQVLRYNFHPPLFKRDSYDVEEYMKTVFIDALKDKLEGIDVEECECMVGVQGRLFQISEDYSVTSPMLGYSVCGSGSLSAMGAMTALIPFTHLSGEEIIRRALEAASICSASVKPPFKILSINGNM